MTDRPPAQQLMLLSTGTRPSRLQLQHLRRAARGRPLRWVAFTRDLEADYGWRLVEDRQVEPAPDVARNGSGPDGAAEGAADDGTDPDEGVVLTAEAAEAVATAGPVAGTVAAPVTTSRARAVRTSAQSVARRSVKRVAGPVKVVVSVLPRTWQDRLQLVVLGHQRGRGATPGKRLSDALLAGPLRADRPDLVVAVDRASAAAAWYTVQALPDLTAVNGVDPAVRYLDLAEQDGASSLHWRAVLGTEEAEPFGSLPGARPARPRVVVVAPSGNGTVLQLPTLASEGLDVVLVRTAEPGGAFLRLEGNRLSVSVDPDRPSERPADLPAGLAADVATRLPAERTAVLVAGLAPDLVVAEAEAAMAFVAGGVPVVEPDPAVIAAAVSALPTGEPTGAPGGRTTGQTHLLVAPANYAGQSAAWSRAVREHAPGADARNLSVAKADAPFSFPADWPLTAPQWRRPEVRARLAVEAVVPATHVLVEALRPVLGASSGGSDVDAWDFRLGRADVDALARSGRRVALVFHGSEVRRPGRHSDEYACSPFRDVTQAAATQGLVRATETVHALLADFDGPVFVSTADLLDDLPGATWLPVVVGADCFRPAPPAMRRRRPVVVHAPSNPFLKGTAAIVPVLARLHAEGVLEYRPLDAVPPMFVNDFVREADVVVDQIVLGNPGVLGAESMAAGRLVVAHVADHVRQRYPRRLPVVDATPRTFEQVMRDICANPERYRRDADEGPAFAADLHSGPRSAAVLADFLGS